MNVAFIEVEFYPLAFQSDSALFTNKALLTLYEIFFLQSLVFDLA